MRMYDLIMKKRNGGVLSEEEIRYMVNGYVGGEIPDYQMSAMMMAIFFRGMNEEETWRLTMAMAESGEMPESRWISTARGAWGIRPPWPWHPWPPPAG